jgi:hypothetical protein
MKQSQIFQQYVWLISTLRRYRRMTFEELNQKWIEDQVTDGNPLQRSTFNRHRDAILNIVGLIIECDQANGYKYYIANPEVLEDDSIERWLFSTLTVSTILSDSVAVKDRIILENVPVGEYYLPVLIQAMKLNRRIVMRYQRFNGEPYEKTVEPYSLRLCKQRWYLLVFTGHHIATYALDRMLSVEMTNETFKMPDEFSPEAYFAEYFGVLTDETPLAHVVVRAYGRTSNYLRTLPLHASQREVASCEDYADFSFDIRPTADFIGELLSYDVGLEVLQPADLREKIRLLLSQSLQRYT